VHFFTFVETAMTERQTAESMGALGGRASAEKLSAAQRKERARQAAAVRWAGNLPEAKYGSPERPLKILAIEIPCYVLDDGRRVIVQAGVLKGLGMAPGTGRLGEGDRLTKFVTGKSLNPFISGDLLEMIKNPVRFKLPVFGNLAYGYEATILADLCDAVLEARKQGALHHQQAHIAVQCEILVRAFTKTGIIALVDEVTGFQDARAKDALAKILEKFVAKDLQDYVKLFPLNYYKGLCRLRGVEFSPDLQLPRYFGHLTNNIIYARLAPAVLNELRRKNPVVNGRRKDKHYNWLTPQTGHPKLLQHIGSVCTLMELAGSDNEKFKKMLEQIHPIYDPHSLFKDIEWPNEDEANTDKKE
jgi:hypothetical protein